MAITRTAKLGLSKASAGTLNWSTFLDANADRLDAVPAIGGLAVTPAETPSASLNVVVASGSWLAQDGSVATLAAPATVAIPASSTARYLWATDLGVDQGAAWPATTVVRLAIVASSATAITGIADARIGQVAGGAAAGGGGGGTTYTAGTGITVTGTVISINTAYTGQASITTLGTVATGTWNATTIAVAKGGTGATTLTGLVKGNGTAAFSAAVAGTDYVTPTGSGAGLTALNASNLTTGTVAPARLGTGTADATTVLYGNGTWGAAGGGGGGSGTVIGVSVVHANGFDGTVANATTTPAITITTDVSGLLKGNGTSILAASAGTDYLTPTGNGSGLTALNASNLATGTVATARLGTGTADATTVLYGNGTWGTVAAGSSGRPGARYATTADLGGSYTYANGTAGVGATLTSNTLVYLGAIDDQSPVAGDLVLVKNQATAAQNGLYVVTQPGSGGTQAWLLTRDPSMDSSAEFGEALVPVATGTVNAGTLWVCPVHNPTVGTTAITFGQAGYLPTAGGTMAAGSVIATNATTGTKLAGAATQKLGFWGATAVIQPASANQAAIGTLTNVTATNGSDQSTPINNNFATLKTLLNQLRADLVAAGLIKGSA